MDFMDLKSRLAMNMRLQKRPGGAFLGAGHGLFELLFYCTKSSTLWGAALFVLHGFYGAEEGFEQATAPRNAPVGRF